MKRSVVLMLAIVCVLPGDVRAQTAVQSFDDLPSVVRPGLAVAVKLDDGRSTSGTVVSLTGDRIEIRRRRWNFRSERLTFSAASVRRVEKRDSTWNGTLLGLGAGVFVAWARCHATRYDALDLSCLPLISIAPAVGAAVGGAIDGAIRRPLYISSGSRLPRAPTTGSGVGIVVTIGF